MNFPRRQAWLCLLALLLLAAPLVAAAQDQAAVLIRGSQIVSGIVSPLADAYQEQSGADITVEVTGTDTGLVDLCGGQIDAAMAARPISNAEAEACAENNVEWVEVPLAYDALAVVVNPTFSFAECLTFPQLATLWQPSAADTTTTWDLINSEWEAASFVLYAPPANSSSYNLLDELLPGDGLRADANTIDDPLELVNGVAADVAGVGFVPWSAVADTEAAVQIASLDDLGGAGCAAPSAETIEDGTYPAARGLYLYVSAESLAREEVTGLLQSMLTEDASAVVAGQGFTPISATQAEQVLANVEGGVTGRQFSEGEPLFTIPIDVAGTVTAENAAGAYPAINDVADAFVGTYPAVNVNATALGNPAAYRRLCSGEVDFAAVTRPPTDEETATCESNGVSLWEVPLGHEAVVMLVPASADYAACLTPEQIGQLWQDQGENTVTNWNQLGEGFPDLPMSIFLPRDGESLTDWILFQATGQQLNPRRDALQENNDPLWRAAATGNIEGGITYVDFASFEATDANVMPVSVNVDGACIAPSLETIRDGSYPFARPINIQVSQSALARPEVQSLLWYMLSDANREVLEGQQVILFDEATFEGYREAIVPQFAEAEAADAAEAEATAVPTEETTEEATEAATEEAPAEEATAEPTGEVTEEAPAEATAEVTAESGS